MATIIWLKKAQYGFGPKWILPDQELRFEVRNEDKFLVEKLTLTEACSSLLIAQLDADDRVILNRVPAQPYTSPLLGKDDMALVEKIRDCFRYQDHSLEEYLKVIDIFRPRAQGKCLDSRVASPRGGIISILLANPTKLPVLAMGLFEGQENCAAPPSRGSRADDN